MRARLPAIALAVAILVSLTPASSSAGSSASVRGDVTCNGAVSLADVTELLQRAAGLGTHIGCPTSSSATLFYTYPGNGEVAKSGEIVVSIFADIPGSLGSWGIDVQFNPMVIQLQTCNPFGSTGCNQIAPNTVRFAGAVGGANGLRGTQHFGDVVFTAIGNTGATSPLNLTVTAASASGQNINAVTDQGSVTVTPGAEPGQPATGTFWPPADLNCDGKVSALDALLLTKSLALSEPVPACTMH
jgi:hypothetical protein